MFMMSPLIDDDVTNDTHRFDSFDQRTRGCMTLNESHQNASKRKRSLVCHHITTSHQSNQSETIGGRRFREGN